MLRTLCAAALALCAMATVADARPVKVDAFDGDRYSARTRPVTFARDVTDAAAKQRAEKRVRREKTHIRAPYRQPRMMVPPPANRYFDVRERAPAGSRPLASIAGRYLGTNPVGWGRVWCGMFLRMVVRNAGLPDLPSGNLARAWARYGSPAPGPVVGAIGVLPHHVGVIIGRCSDGSVLMRSGNHGHQVGDGCYSAGRFIAFRAAG